MSNSSASALATLGLSPALVLEELKKQAAAERARRKEHANRPSIIDYVAELCPVWDRFDYFAPYAEQLSKAIGGNLRVCFAAPPQHGKSEFTLRGLLYIARYFPGYRHAYVTYNDDRAKTVAKLFKRIAEEAGFDVGGTLDQIEIRWDGGKISTFKFTSIGGSLTGFPLDGLCVIDDPIKDREESRSAAKRRACVEWWQSVARTRRHPGTSFIVMATRWPGGDLTDHLLKKEGWQYINLKAIAAGAVNDNGVVIDDPLGRKAGESLWKRKPPEFFREDQADLFWWSSMFQGEPTSQGTKVFAEPGTVIDGRELGPGYYRELPTSGYRIAFGVDLAYTAKTSADWSVTIEGIAYKRQLYVTRVIRKQVDAPTFLLTLVSLHADKPLAPFRFYASGTESGSAQFIQRKLGRCFKVINASADKLVRATPASVTWNMGNVLLPDPAVIDAPWLEGFVAIMCAFTGTPGEPDDDVDAFSALHDELLNGTRMVDALKESPMVAALRARA
jgi:predicted phage terminase large subunit-like protein